MINLIKGLKKEDFNNKEQLDNYMNNVLSKVKEIVSKYNIETKIQAQVTLFENGTISTTIELTYRKAYSDLKYTEMFTNKDLTKVFEELDNFVAELDKQKMLITKLAKDRYNSLIELINQGYAVYYHYDLMGVLSFDKVNKKSITCFDITNKKHYITKDIVNSFDLAGFTIE